MKSTKNRAISIMICLLMLAQIVPSSWSSVPVFAYSPEPEEMANTKNDIDLPIDPFHVLSYVSAKPATCTDSGNKAYYACSDCGKWFEDSLGTVEITDKSSVVIPAAEHIPAEAVRENEVAATCCAAGSYDEVIYCSVCHEEVSREPKTIPIDEDAHDWGEWMINKLDEANTHIRYCVCDESQTAPHNFDDGKVTTEATHTSKGVKTFTCTDCGYSYTEEIPETIDHEWSDWYSNQDGTHARSCACNEVETEDCEWDDGVITKPATENSTGIKTYTCAVCRHTRTEIIPVVEHTHVFDESVVAEEYLASRASCTDPARYYHSCKCGEKGTETFALGEKLAHTAGEWTVTVPPVGFEAGERVKTCTTCGETLVTEAIYHSFGLGDETNADKTLTGLGEGVSPDELTAHFGNLGYEVTITDADGKEADYVGTGIRVTVGEETYEIIVKGDVYSDGNIDIFDLMSLLDHVNGDAMLEGVYMTAGLVYNEEEVDIFDLMTLLDHVNGDALIAP